MASLSKKLFVFSDGSVKIETYDPDTPPAPAPVQWYMQKEDRDVFGSIRSCAPCPAVFVMKDDQHAKITQQWQYYIRAINYNMSLKYVYRLLVDDLAFANRTGFQSMDKPGRADYFFNRDLHLDPPQFDKVRTTSRSVLSGTEEFNVPTFITDAFVLARKIISRQTTFMSAKNGFRGLLARSENVLRVNVFDSRELPSLKPGYSYPQDISEIDPNAYLYMPETHPEMFLVANIVKANGDVYQFPYGALYPWIDRGMSPYSFIPHIANLAYGPVLYPLRYLTKVPVGDPKPRAYTI
jgi:hypothetical protein